MSMSSQEEFAVQRTVRDARGRLRSCSARVRRTGPSSFTLHMIADGVPSIDGVFESETAAAAAMLSAVEAWAVSNRVPLDS